MNDSYMKTIPFTYRVSWTKEDLHYYGVKYAEGCSPSDLWTVYFTSSPKVKELRKSLGEPDVIEIRKTFKTKEKAWDWEIRVMHRLNVVYNSKWVNLCMFPCRDNTGRKLSQETKDKISKSMSGKNHPNFGKHLSKETRKKISEGNMGRIKTGGYRTGKGKDHPFYGKKHTPETIAKMRKSQLGSKNPMYGKKLSEEQKEALSRANKGRKHTEETKKRCLKQEKELCFLKNN